MAYRSRVAKREQLLNLFRAELMILVGLPPIVTQILQAYTDWRMSGVDLGMYGMLITATLVAFGLAKWKDGSYPKPNLE